jgi:hypothetical protein
MIRLADMRTLAASDILKGKFVIRTPPTPLRSMSRLGQSSRSSRASSPHCCRVASPAAICLVQDGAGGSRRSPRGAPAAAMVAMPAAMPTMMRTDR